MRQRIIPAVPEKIIEEEILSYTVDMTNGTVTVILGELDENNSVTSNRLVSLGADGYDMLVEAENPSWARGKPKGEFRRADIFAVMDMLGIE